MNNNDMIGRDDFYINLVLFVIHGITIHQEKVQHGIKEMIELCYSSINNLTKFVSLTIILLLWTITTTTTTAGEEEGTAGTWSEFLFVFCVQMFDEVVICL
jgi:hypothetical protein